ncbi:MAG: hypothetical protein H6668_20155 [Ardenticatenaceae bacterium]|nr:hypothetical protein [Ardenticatenaceae bacterium]
MRPLELLSLLLTLPPLIYWLLGRPSPRWLGWVGLTAVLLTLLHLLIERYRWQMVPAYLLVAIVGLGSIWQLWVGGAGLPRTAAVALAALGLLLFLVAAALPIAIPIPKLVPPTGPYAIGTATYYLRDDSRAETYSPIPGGPRELMVQIWYPATAATDAPRAPYLTDYAIAAPAIAAELHLPGFMFSHLNLVLTEARQGAAFVAENGRFPLLIFSHGVRVGFRGQNSSQIQELVSHGYVVVAIDHTYGGLFTVFPDGRVVFFNNDTVFGGDYTNLPDAARLIDVWADDIGFVLDEMARWDGGEGEGGGLFNGRLDLTQVGVFGHSTGGGAAITFCNRDNRCRAVVGLDSWVEPLDPAAIHLSQPFMSLSTPRWLGEANNANGQQIFRQLVSQGYLLKIANTEHFDFSDLPLFSPLTPQLGLSGTINSQYSQQLMNAYLVAFFDQTLKGQPSDLLNRSDSPYPEVDFAKNK